MITVGRRRCNGHEKNCGVSPQALAIAEAKHVDRKKQRRNAAKREVAEAVRELGFFKKALTKMKLTAEANKKMRYDLLTIEEQAVADAEEAQLKKLNIAAKLLYSEVGGRSSEDVSCEDALSEPLRVTAIYFDRRRGSTRSSSRRSRSATRATGWAAGSRGTCATARSRSRCCTSSRATSTSSCSRST